MNGINLKTESWIVDMIGTIRLGKSSLLWKQIMQHRLIWSNL